MVTCGSEQRTASIDSASYCETGLKNPKVVDINTNFKSVTGWENVGELTSNGTDQFLSANLTLGSWGSSSIEGNWQIDRNFWSTYDQAVISMHVGHGKGGPDHFSWLIIDDSTMGTWSYDLLSGKGGGLSNFKLWGANTPNTKEILSSVSVPEPASILLMGLGLIGIIRVRTKLTVS